MRKVRDFRVLNRYFMWRVRYFSFDPSAITLQKDTRRYAAFFCIELSNLFEQCVRQAFLSAVLCRPQTLSRSEIRCRTSFANEQDVLLEAVRIGRNDRYKRCLRRGYVIQVDEPTWTNFQTLGSICQAIGCDLESRAQLVATAPKTHLDYLAALRNYFAHKSQETRHAFESEMIRIGTLPACDPITFMSRRDFDFPRTNLQWICDELSATYRGVIS